MLENLTQEQAKQKILEAVGEYYTAFHQKKGIKTTRIPYASRVYDQKEMQNLTDGALDFWLTSGEYTDRFEKELAKYLGVRFCSLVNSGSSANLLAFMALTSPLLKERRILPGDEVITVAACFPTTVAPILQYGAVPVFIDLTPGQYNLDVTQLEEALTPKTRAVMAAHTLGNPFNIAAVKAFCDRNNLWLIEDNCDALGSEYCLDGAWGKTGSMGDIGTSSFYPPHHITMGEGGAVYTSNPLLHKVIRSLRDWGRDCICASGQDNCCGCRFSRQFGQLPLGYDHKYVYSHLGYNLKATDLQASIGVAQLEKLPDFVQRRRGNFARLEELLTPYAHRLILPRPCPDSRPSWFGYLMTCREGVIRNQVTGYLEEHGIQTRTLFAGNIIKHPCFDHIRGTSHYRVVGELTETERVLHDSFWIGVYPGLEEKHLQVMAQTVGRALAEGF
ncbi:lipopolysaccharide biosynthesis protein RfbH [Oscillospiraceae bacterium MB08-C2-2]|nr:lipopolysaccharide biosynthesis protein RfbH [Oscillospiraceae bacterium MB08-C2-2]